MLIAEASEVKNVSINLDNGHSKRTLSNRYTENFQDRINLLTKTRKKLNNKFYNDILPFINFNLPLFDNENNYDVSTIEQLRILLSNKAYFKNDILPHSNIGSIKTDKGYSIYLKPIIEYSGNKLPYLKLIPCFEALSYPFDTIQIWGNIDILTNDELKNVISYNIFYYNINDFWNKRLNNILNNAIEKIENSINCYYSSNTTQELYIKDMLKKNY